VRSQGALSVSRLLSGRQPQSFWTRRQRLSSWEALITTGQAAWFWGLINKTFILERGEPKRTRPEEITGDISLFFVLAEKQIVRGTMSLIGGQNRGVVSAASPSHGRNWKSNTNLDALKGEIAEPPRGREVIYPPGCRGCERPP
jgi:hypothetical protein